MHLNVDQKSNTSHAERGNCIIQSGNVGKFFSYANRKFTCKSSLGPLSTSDGSLTTDSVRKAELLRSVFSTAFTKNVGLLPSGSSNPVVTIELSTITFTPTLVKRVIRRIIGEAEGGPDDIPRLFFEQCCNQLSSPLAFILNQCMNHGYIPPLWLQAFLTPIFEKGNKTDLQNYRPIALTYTVSEIMETVITDKILDFLLQIKLISKYQHGFMRRHLTNFGCTHYWIVGLSNTTNIDVVYADFSKAFDSIVFSKIVV